MPTLEITNFGGRLTRYNHGDINSGTAKYLTTFGNDPFSKPSNLTWFESPIQIDSAGTYITDLIVAARPRLESGITYVYAVGHTGRLYRIQVNAVVGTNPNYDNPVLLTTLTAQTPTFRYGSSIQFFGATERIFIGHDRGVTRVDFDGTNETFVGTQSSYTSSVPRPSVSFLGRLYFGNGVNLVEIDSTAAVVSYARLSPAFPIGTVVRDIDVSPDGNYTQIVVSRIAAADMTITTQDTNSLSSADSYLVYWNGIDPGYNAYNPYNAYSLNANTSFGGYSYTMGYDLGGAAIYAGSNKVISLPNSVAPNFGAMFSTGNLVGFGSPEQNASVLRASISLFGQYDNEIPEGLYRIMRVSATSPQTDVIQMPVCLIVSNLFYGSSSAGYTGNQVGSAKLYFSTFETSSTTSVSRFYKFTTVPTGLGSVIAGVYETQTQLFSKKVTVKEVRIYGEPWVTNNAFTVALIGSDGGVIANSSQTFTAGTNLTVGDDFAWYNPGIESTYALGVRITNSGSTNNTITKIEIDWEKAGR